MMVLQAALGKIKATGQNDLCFLHLVRKDVKRGVTKPEEVYSVTFEWKYKKKNRTRPKQHCVASRDFEGFSWIHLESPSNQDR